MKLTSKCAYCGEDCPHIGDVICPKCLNDETIETEVVVIKTIAILTLWIMALALAITIEVTGGI